MASHRRTNNNVDAIVKCIKNDNIHAVVAANEARLFRDAAALQVNAFIRLCLAHNVVVVTPQLVYDFHSPSMVRLFRFMCQQAYRALQDC